MERLSSLTVADVLAGPTVYRRTRTESSAADIGWGFSDAGCILEVVGWLLVEMPDEWGDVDSGEVQRVAYWLLTLRDQLVEKGLICVVASGSELRVVDPDWRPPAPCRAAAARPAGAGAAGVPVSIEARIRLSVGVWVTCAMALLPWISGRFRRKAKR